LSIATLPRVTGAGAAFALLAILCWVGFQAEPRLFVIPYIVALALTAACGLYLLLATWHDSYRRPRRGSRIRPIRGFDIGAGLLLAGPALLALRPFLAAFWSG
jgi:hypothetical protein